MRDDGGRLVGREQSVDLAGGFRRHDTNPVGA
jgi:hypothetical protein